MKFANVLERFAFRSPRQIGIHILIAIVIAVILALTLSNKIVIYNYNFVTIVSSIATIAGVLLAVTFALVSFFSIRKTEEREWLLERLERARVKVRQQMEKSANSYPDIARYLAIIYGKSELYMPGKYKADEILTIDHPFLEWAKNQTPRKILDPGNPLEYETFEFHIRDAISCNHDLKQALLLSALASQAMRTIPVFSPLIMAWIIILGNYPLTPRK